MKVQNKILLLLFSLTVGFALATALYMGGESERVNILFRNSVKEKRESFNKLFDNESNRLLTLVSEEYGLWADMADFVTNPTKEFSEYNLDWMVEGYNLSSVWVYDKNRELVHFVTDDSSVFSGFPFNNEDYFNLADSTNEQRYYGIVNGKLTHFIATTLHKSYDDYLQNNIHGYLIIARSFEDKLKDYFQELTESEINVSFDIPPNFDQIQIDFASGNSTFNKKIIDWRGDVIAVLTVNIHSEFVQEFYNSSGNVITMYILLCILLLGGFYIFHHFLVTRPLSKIIVSLNSENTDELQNYFNSSNEFGQLANLISSFFKQKAKLVKEINERQKAQEELYTLNQVLESKIYERTKEIQLLIEQSPLAIATYNTDGTLLTYNKKFQETFGHHQNFNSDYLSFMSLFVSDLEEFQIDFNRLVKRGNDFMTPPLQVKYEKIKRIWDSEKWFVFRFYGIVNEANEILKVVNLVEDITELKKAEIAEQKVERQKIITAKILEAQENERKRISMELHDSIGHILTSARISLTNFINKHSFQDNGLASVKDSISNVGKELLNIIHQLHPVDLEKFGLEKSIRTLCNELSKVSDCRIMCNTFDLPAKLPFQYEITIYRIVQEALNNISKHSQAKEASVQLFFRNYDIILEINDDGIGFETDSYFSSSNIGRGLENMMRRVESLNGVFEIDSNSNYGTEIHIKIPVRNEIKENINS